MKKWRLVYLQLVVTGMLIGLFGLAGVAISLLIKRAQQGFSLEVLLDKPGYFILMAGLLSLIPCLLILVHVLKILRLLKKSMTVVSILSSSFGTIKICFILISCVAVGLFPVMFIVADRDDAPGLILFAFILILIPATLGIISSLLQSLVKQKNLISGTTP